MGRQGIEPWTCGLKVRTQTQAHSGKIDTNLHARGTERQNSTNLQSFQIVRFCLRLPENSENGGFCRPRTVP